MPNRYERVLLHPEVQVVAGGWTSTIYRLYRHGWEFEVQLSDYGRQPGILARNPKYDQVGVFKVNAFIEELERLLKMGGLFLYFHADMILESEHGTFRQMYIDDSLRIDTEIGKYDEYSQTMITYTPSRDDKPEELIVTPDKVPELLRMIREAQEPAAKELLHKQARRDDLQQMKQTAKILTFK